VVLTSNGEREFPPAFLRRCIRLRVPEPGPDQLARIIEARLRPSAKHEAAVERLIADFHRRRNTPAADGKKELATDQLLNAVHLLLHGCISDARPAVLELVLRSLNEAPPEEK
jgi:MoxR-like ATPase